MHAGLRVATWHAIAHARAHTYTYTCMRAHTFIYIHTHMHTHINVQKACVYAHRHMHARHTHTHARIYTSTQSRFNGTTTFLLLSPPPSPTPSNPALLRPPHSTPLHPSRPPHQHPQRSGVVVFHEAAGAAAALAAAGTGQVIEYELPVPEGPRGLKAWVQQHKAQRPGTAALQKQVGAGLAGLIGRSSEPPYLGGASGG